MVAPRFEPQLGGQTEMRSSGMSSRHGNDEETAAFFPRRSQSARRLTQYLRGVFAIHPLKASIRQAESIQTPVIAELLAFVEVLIQRF